MASRRVTTIPATRQRFTAAPVGAASVRRVAAYARVSTDHEEQLTSYEAQVDYYTRYIEERDGWVLAGIYTGEGITGTSTKRREGFKAMVADALAGDIDLIVAKSVSRFARNTVDSLTTIRSLKEAGVEVFFEKENIWTFDGKGELLLTIMSSLAQEESRSISENCTWGQRKRFADGKVTVPFSRFLGYDRGEDGSLVVNPEQAKVVRRIYSMFLSGKTYRAIAVALTEDGIPTPGGKGKWVQGTVKSILTNEKYKGDALLQKRFTVDFLTKRQKVNEGEVPQYYVEGDHEAIIEPAVFEAAQREVSARSRGGYRSCASPFSSKVKCAHCGAWYGPKVWHSNDKYRRVIWQCNGKFEGEVCPTPHVTEEELEEAFVKAVNKLLPKREEVCAALRRAMDAALATATLEEERDVLRAEVEASYALIDKCIAENARVALDQEDYRRRYDALVKRAEEAEAALAEADAEISRRAAARADADVFIADMESAPDVVAKFDERLWHAIVDFATVHEDGTITVTFKDGSEL